MSEWYECPICGKRHDGAEEVCGECQDRIERSVSRIMWVLSDYAQDLIDEESGMNRLPREIIAEGVKERMEYR